MKDDFLEKFGIAIIGMAGRFPGADSIEEFWQNMTEGRESITFFSEEELQEAGVTPEVRSDPNYVPAKGILNNIKGFDASFFNISPREAELIDPQQRIFLECAWEALEQAGYDPEKIEDRVGVFASSSKNTYLMLNLLSHPEMRLQSTAVQALIANDKDYVSTRTSYKLNLKGPSVTVQTACSSSLVAIHLACQSLLSHESDMVLAGGTSIDVPHKSGYTYLPEGIFSPDGHCRPFDKDARGTVFGQGVGVVLLKPYARAVEDNDYIYAVIRGSAINNDGADKVGFTAPGVVGQASVIADALANADVDAETISYVETHGTGTSLGDPIEVEALSGVFREDSGKNQFCALGSVKSNIGHLNAASGVTGLIKTALSLKNEELPPLLHFKEANSHIDFANSPFYISKGESWRASRGKVRRAGVSSFGIGGTNAHVILEEAPPGKRESAGHEVEGWHLLIHSARSLSALDRSTEKLGAYLAKKEGIRLQDVAYTLQTGRRAFAHRRMVVCSQMQEAVELLKGIKGGLESAVVKERVDSLVFLLSPFENDSVVALASELCTGESYFKREYEACSTLLKSSTGEELSELPPYAMQFVFQYALTRLWMHWGLEADMVIGYGMGELVGAVLSGLLSIQDALSIISLRVKSQGLDELYTFVRSLKLEEPQIPFISACSGRQLTKSDLESRDYWSLQLTRPQQFESSLLDKIPSHNSILLNLGGGKVKGNGFTYINVFNPAEVTESGQKALLTTLGRLWMAGLEPDWQAVNSGKECYSIPLTTYPFEHKEYWINPREEQQGPSTQVKSGQLHERGGDSDIIEPRTQMERDFEEIFRQLLGIEKISVTDDFFDLGGDSLLGTKFVALVQERFDIRIRLDVLFESPTIEGVSSFMEKILKEESGKGKSEADNRWCEEDLYLGDDIYPKSKYTFREEDAVFITGSTGFLGSYILNELLSKTECDVYCLVRASSKKDGLERLRKGLDKYGFATDNLEKRVYPIVGNLTDPSFGIAPDEYRMLAETVSVIYHCGARLSFIEPYRSLRNINVQGTRNAIHLAATGQSKHIHHVSSIAAFDSDSFKNFDLVDESFDLSQSKGFHSGYDETKWVSEMLIAEAGRRGFPVTVYRPGNITGDSVTGTFSSTDLIGRIMRGCLEMGCAPDNADFVDLEPIDYVAKTLFHLSRKPDSIGEIYHITNPHFIRWYELVEMVRSIGFPLKTLPFDEWRNILREKARENSKNALVPLLPMFDYRPLFSGRRYNSLSTVKGLEKSGIECPPITPALLKLYTEYLSSVGALDVELTGVES